MRNRQSTELLEFEAYEKDSPEWLRRRHLVLLSCLEWIAVAILTVAFVTRSFVPGWQTLKSEFPNYYLAAELYRHNVPLDRIYEWTWFQRQNDHWGVRDGLVSFAPNPPTLILASVPLTRLRPLAAKRVWLILSLVFLGLSLEILRRVTTIGWRRLLLISLLCILPLNADFLFARHYVFVLFLVCAGYYAASLGEDGISGAIWSVASTMKLFPALVLILFFRKRNGRALVGFLIGMAFLVTLSVLMFGAETHRVFLREVLSQASRGDWLGPYALSQNSFTTLWSRLFLFEPELNPSPLLNSPMLYALLMAITVAGLVCAFLCFAGEDQRQPAMALQWAAFVPLMLLLCSTTASDYWCLLIFSAVVGTDALLLRGKSANVLILLLLYVAACAPIPGRISSWFPSRLLTTMALFVWLLYCAVANSRRVSTVRWLVAGLILAGGLTLYNLQLVRHREEDFGRRLPASGMGYRFATPVPVAGGVAYTEMHPNRYGVALATKGVVREAAFSGDALTLAGSSGTAQFYSELSGRKSFLLRLSADQFGSLPELMAEGQEPTLSSNGQWLAFIREEEGERTAWLWALGSGEAPQLALPNSYQPLDLTVTDNGDVIAAAGGASYPHLLRFRRSTREITSLSEYPRPVRYPSISPDGRLLAFSQRDRGSWHLYVRELETGAQRQLTHAWCSALSPSWVDTKTLLYATDCGRGVGLTAIARVVLTD